jgi:putative ABC transport system permease protein
MKQLLHLRPIMSALLRSPIATVLIGLQIALTLALVSNALFICVERFALIGRPSGMDEANTFVVSSTAFGEHINIQAMIALDLETIRAMPGVRDAAPAVAVPDEGGGWTEDVYLSREQATPTTDDVAVYFTDDHGLDAYGAELIAGRNFLPQEIGWRDADNEEIKWPNGVIVTRALALRLYPDGTALGKQFSFDKAEPSTIIGIVDRLQAADAHHTNIGGDPDLVEYAILVPQILFEISNSRYLVRTEAGRRDELMRSVSEKLTEIDPMRTIEHVDSVAQLRDLSYDTDRAMMVILGIVISCLLVVTGLGIVGLSQFWVLQRTNQIGVRRALGASSGDILRYFLAENLIITTCGLAMGAIFAYALNLFLMRTLGEHRLPWHYLPFGFAILLLLGQLAVLGPARSASRVAPATASRGSRVL